MRFHHSTRRGRNRLGQYSQHHSTSGSNRTSRTSTSRWSQLGYCRETNIHFNRRLPIEPPTNLNSNSNSNSNLNVTTTTSKDHRYQALSSEDRLRSQHSLELTRMASTGGGGSEGASPDSGTSGLLHDPQNQLDIGRLALSNDELSPKTKNHQDSSTLKTQISFESGNTTTTTIATADQLIDIESAREKLVAQVEKHPFWSNKAAKRMQLNGLQHRRIYIYELISFCERRDLEWRFEPYRGGLVPSIPIARHLSHENQQQHHSIAASQPTTPVGSPAHRSIRVPLPQQNASLEQEPLVWSLTTTTGSGGEKSTTTRGHQERDKIRRCRSNASSPTRPNAATSTGTTTYRVNSSIERKLPPAEFVWSIEAPVHLRPEPFVGQMHSLELPGSSFIKRCHGCQGRGRLKCASCYGVGYEVCISCSGRGTTRNHGSGSGGLGARMNDRCNGYSASSRNSTSASGYDDGDSTDYRLGSDSRGRGNEPGGITLSSGSSGSVWTTESCHFCHGAGQKRCWVCAGKSYNHCTGCQGLGQLRCYLNLNITWTNHRDEVFLNNSDNIIPKERLRLCSGLLLAEDSNPKLKPLKRAQIDGATGSVEDSNQLHLASKRLLDKHLQTYRHERLIKQRHKVTQIQCHKVNYEWKHRRGHFVIYGDERKVYIAKYPFKSICNIT